MPTVFDLIDSENLAQAIFILSSLLGIEAGFTGKKAELLKEQGSAAESQKTTIKTTEIAINSNLLSLLSYLIFLIVAIQRKNQVLQEIQAGNSNASIKPNNIIIVSFIFSLIGTSLRLMVANQRLEEAQLPVSLL
jgi:hypothetical protein